MLREIGYCVRFNRHPPSISIPLVSSICFVDFLLFFLLFLFFLNGNEKISSSSGRQAPINRFLVERTRRIFRFCLSYLCRFEFIILTPRYQFPQKSDILLLFTFKMFLFYQKNLSSTSFPPLFNGRMPEHI